MKFQPNIIPVCVPDSDEDLVGSRAWVTGWGRLYEGEHQKEVTRNGMLCKENYIFLALHNEIISFNKCMALTHERIEN